MTEEEVMRKAEKKYGTDIHLFGQQRDGYVVGYKAAESDTDKWKSIAEALYQAIKDNRRSGRLNKEQMNAAIQNYEKAMKL